MSRAVKREFRLSRWIIVYLAALVLGITVAVIYALISNSELPGNAVEMAQGYSENGVLPNEDAPHTVTSVLVYTFENEREAEMIGGLSYIDYDAVLCPLIQKAAEGQQVKTITLYPNIHEAERTGFILVVGTRIPESESVLFIVRKLANFDSIILFIIGCTVLYTMGAIFMYILDKKNRETEKMRQQYISNVSHELKSPIASILALTASLNDGMAEDEESRVRYYNLILSEAKNLDHTVTDMLALSKIQTGRMDFSKRSVPASEVFEAVAGKYTTLCDDMGIDFHAPENYTALPMLITNPERAAQLLDIILDNAVKFVDEDGAIWLDVSVHSRDITVCVRDNGIGIGKDALPHVFERFYMADVAHNARGSGLGLAIAMETAENLGEKLWVSSEEGRGSSFFFTIETA